jgi:hypothetical protein
VSALQSNTENSEVVRVFVPSNINFYEFVEKVENACLALSTLCTGNAHNRNLFGKANACEHVKQLMAKYYQNPTVAQALCKAVFFLASGSTDHKAKFSGIQTYIQQIINNKEMPEATKKDAKDALRFV